MIIRLFAFATNDNEARLVIDNVLDSINQNIERTEYLSCEPYWKIEGVYAVELKISFKNEISEINIENWLNDISDKWLLFGSPTNEFLASITTKDCNFIKDGIYMINIIFDEYEK